MRHLRLILLAAVGWCVIGSSALAAWPSVFPASVLHPREISSPSIYLIKRNRTSSSSVLIRNIRFHRHRHYTRLVLDLNRSASYTTRHVKRSGQVILQVPRARLTPAAQRILRQGGFPGTVHIANAKRHLAITLDMSRIDRYQVLTLTKPHRLVLDLYPASSPGRHGTGKKQPASPPVSTPQHKLGEGMVIVIDPGHGGKDPGALGRRGTKEKHIVLQVAKHLKTLITERLGATVLMTRNKDIFVPLEDRAKLANEKNADLFISIHVNSHPKRRIKGLELYHFGEASDPRALEVAARENGTPFQENGPAWQFILAEKLTDKKIEKSQEFAWTLRKSLISQLKRHYAIKDHGVKTAPFYVLRMTTMPSILAELAFISNPREEKLLTSAAYQRRVAEGIFEGIRAYITPLQTAAR